MFAWSSTTGQVPVEESEPTLAAPVSQLCTESQFHEPVYARWCETMREAPRPHRKQWEFCYILQALESRGMLAPGRRALGFGVGADPLTAVLASRGVEVTATDLAPDAAIARRWINVEQHAAGLGRLNERGICPPDEFARLVRFEACDMRAAAGRFSGYDVVFSSCAFEHLGTLEAGARFVLDTLGALRPGGVAVHTTEHNLADGWRTRRRGPTVLYRRRDLERLFARAAGCGFATRANWSRGSGELDAYVDLPPYTEDRHLKVGYRGYEATSFGMILEGR